MNVELEKVCFLFHRMRWTEENEIGKQNKDIQWDCDKRLGLIMLQYLTTTTTQTLYLWWKGFTEQKQSITPSQPCDRQHVWAWINCQSVRLYIALHTLILIYDHHICNNVNSLRMLISGMLLFFCELHKSNVGIFLKSRQLSWQDW